SATFNYDAVWNRASSEASRRVADDLREVIGNPFRSFLPDPHWLRWRDGVVVRIARDIYEGQSFDETPVLADALEDAGCDDTEMWQPLRSGRGHVRGCWAVDRVLGLE